MTKYIDQELARYWPVSKKLMDQYKDGTHTAKYRGDNLYWQNKNGEWHRDEDKPAIIFPDGGLQWCQNNQLHRDDDKPAWISKSGELGWCQNDQIHRFCGPAVIYQDGRLEWWINGEEITQEVNEWLDGKEWRGTPEQIFEFKLRFL